nr:cytochrome c maturation protein CcmE [Ardenticatena sp.]
MTVLVREEPYIGPIPKRKFKFVVGGMVILLAMVFLIYQGVRAGGAYYITLEELRARGDAVVGDMVRVEAPVDKESVEYDTRNIVLRFDMVDEQGNRLPVVYHDVMPDLFMKSTSVIVEGRLNENGVFEASNILVKCPSKYEEAAEAGAEVPTDHYQPEPSNGQ